ncbi:MAG: L,D-transpeptidase family protein [Candidatus Competibacteraceae bacterium]
MAQTANKPEFQPSSTSANPAKAATIPAVASLNPSQETVSGDEQEPEAAIPAETAQPAEAAAPPPLPPCPKGNDPIASRICQQIRTEPPLTSLQVDGLNLHSLAALISFYAQRDYQAAWVSADGRPLPAASTLLTALSEADHEGLRSADYHRAQLQKLLNTLQQNNAFASANQLAEFDLVFTDAFLTYGSHLLAGRLPPRKVDPDWAIKPRSRDLAAVLQDALAKDKVAETLRALTPQNKGYTQLREVLRKYQQVAKEGGWSVVSAGPNLGLGSQGQRVQSLRARLQASGDLNEGGAGKNAAATFDKPVADAVRRFQRRHGLPETGVVNSATLAVLNVPVAERIRQIELNLERWRWLPDGFGSRYIMVNIPSFKMNVVENDKRVMEANVVVGRQERQTPTFTANMAYLVLSPKWYVPRSIAVKDKLPQLKRNPYALARQNIRVYSHSGQEINPGSVNWRAVSANSFNYQLRQDSGPRNALGGIKFMFPNPYNVYLHDTPSRELFSRNQRTYSSGCIRISNPVELAQYLLKHDPHWTRDAIKTASASGKQRVVTLPQQVPVYLLYWTVWVDEEGLAQFRGDIYNRDKSLVRALNQESAPGSPRHGGV